MAVVMPPSSGLPGGFHHQNGLNMRLPMDYQQNYYIKKVEPALPQPNYYVRKTVEATRGRVIPRGPKQQPSAVKPKLASCGLPGCKGCQIPNLKFNPSVGDGGPPRVRNPSLASTAIKPLFVDCSVEYELPNVPKIPPDSQPLLVIHPGWKRRVTRSSSQQRLIIEAEQRKHQQYLQYHMFNCAQCPQQPPVQLGRKRTYHQAASLPQPHIRRPQPQPHPLTEFPTDAPPVTKRARWQQMATPSNFCNEQECLELHHRQMALMHQQQHHSYLLRNQNWQPCPLPLPAPPPPVSNPTGFFHNYYQHHAAYFCPPQQQWLFHQQQHQSFNNNNCVKCVEGKCNMMFCTPQQQQQQQRTVAMTNVRYRSV